MCDCFLGHFFEKCRNSPHFWATFSPSKSYVLLFTKMVWVLVNIHIIFTNSSGHNVRINRLPRHNLIKDILLYVISVTALLARVTGLGDFLLWTVFLITGLAQISGLLSSNLHMYFMLTKKEILDDFS
jgi:hypothetical protein